MRYLIVYAEDNVFMRNFIQNQLEEIGHEVFAVGNGEEARQEVIRLKGTKRKPLLLTDDDMPGISGMELVRRVRAEEAREK